MDKVLFIDGANLIWRACVKFSKSWGDKESTKENAHPDEVIFTFNFFRNLRPIIEELSPDKCFFVLEGRPQFRYDLFADYKANRIIKEASRKENNETFFKTKDIILPLLQHLPITICRAADFEADDVISTLCENMKNESLTVLSNDSDYIQLLQRDYTDCKIYNPIKKEYMTAPTYPYVAWKCLNGDKSDNIPALLKPKKALDTVQDPIKFQTFLKVEENRANFSVNRQLIEFRLVPEDEISLIEGHRDFVALRQEFIKMQFESITNDKSWEKYCDTFNCLKF